MTADRQPIERADAVRLYPTPGVIPTIGGITLTVVETASQLCTLHTDALPAVRITDAWVDQASCKGARLRMGDAAGKEHANNAASIWLAERSEVFQTSLPVIYNPAGFGIPTKLKRSDGSP